MFAKLRIFQAALELREFSIADLASKSGVSKSTVQKTLRRHSKLFFTSDVKPERRIGNSKYFQSDTEALRSILIDALDDVELATASKLGAGDNLPLKMAEDALTKSFPASSDIRTREIILQTVDLHLDSENAIEDPELFIDLVKLRDSLRHILKVLKAAVAHPDRGIRDYHQSSILESLISLDRRNTRDSLQEQLNSDTGNLRNLVALRTHHHTLTLYGSVAAKPASQETIAAAWQLLTHRLWTHVVGDLAERLKTQAISPSSNAEAFYGGVEVTIAEHQPLRDWEPRISRIWTTGRLGPYYPHHGDPLAPSGSKSEDILRVDFQELAGQRRNTIREHSLNKAFAKSVDLDLVGARAIRVGVPSIAWRNAAVPFEKVRWDGHGFTITEDAEAVPVEGDGDILTVRECVCIERREPIVVVRLYMPPGSGLPVFSEDNDIAGLSFTSNTPISDVLWLDIDAPSGNILVAHAQHRVSRHMQTIPFANLAYRSERGGFVITGSLGLIQTDVKTYVPVGLLGRSH